MSNRLMSSFFIVVVFLFGASTAHADIKIKTRNTVAGQSSEGTVHIKGARQRTTQSFGGFEMVTLLQCDLKRSIQINDRARTYMVTPLDESTPESTEPPAAAPAGKSEPVRTRKGGVVTYTTTITDTGERKKMFGYNARRIKTVMSAESSPDACNPVKMRIETDGWYIDFEYSFNCDSDRPVLPSSPTERSRPECRDEMRFRQSGGGKLGYPVWLMTTMYGEGGQTMSTTMEVVELSAATLDTSLFEIPEGYAEARNYQELMGIPSAGAIIRGEVPRPPGVTAPGAITAKRAGVIRVGVVSIGNKTDRSPSLDSLRNKLITGITESNVDAVPLDSGTAAEIEAEARQKECDYILYTEVAELKKSGRMGGLLGRATGVGALKERHEARLDYRLFPTGGTSPQLTASASAKEEGPEDASLTAAAEQEARRVVAEVRKRK